MHIATKEPNTICGSLSGSVEGRSVHRYSRTAPDLTPCSVDFGRKVLAEHYFGSGLPTATAQS